MHFLAHRQPGRCAAKVYLSDDKVCYIENNIDIDYLLYVEEDVTR
jgi:hypothetical protein